MEGWEEMEGWKDGRRWKDGRMEGWEEMEGWKDGRMGGWMDEPPDQSFDSGKWPGRLRSLAAVSQVGFNKVGHYMRSAREGFSQSSLRFSSNIKFSSLISTICMPNTPQ